MFVDKYELKQLVETREQLQMLLENDKLSDICRQALLDELFIVDDEIRIVEQRYIGGV